MFSCSKPCTSSSTLAFKTLNAIAIRHLDFRQFIFVLNSPVQICTYIYKFMYKCFVFNFVFLGVSLLFRLLFLLCTHVHIFNLTNKFLLYLRTIETNEPIEQNEKFWCNDIFGNLHASRL